MLAKAATSCLDLADVKKLQFEPYTEDHALEIYPKWAGFKIPYFQLNGKVDPAFYRFRYIQTKPSKGFAAVADEPKKPRRYGQPAASTGVRCGVYLPPLLGGGTWAEIAADPKFSLVITEGELKAACACRFGIHTIGLGGVYNWRAAKDNQELLPILEQFVWDGRKVVICFDSDMETNPMVRTAASRLAFTLAMKGALIEWAQLPPTDKGEKQGLDDFVFAHGIEALATVLQETEELGPGQELHRLNSEVALIKSTSEIVELYTGNVYSASIFSESRFKNRTYPETDNTGRMLRKFAAKEWLAWESRTEVTKLDYAPQCNNAITEDGAFNTWYPQRWPLVPTHKGTIQPWINLFGFIMEGLSDDNKQWAKQWFAAPIQVPGLKLYTAMLIWGRQQGTGKTLLGDTMKHIYGRNYGTVNNDQLKGQFTEWCLDKQFIVGDEISIGDRRGVANTLKDLITRNMLRMNIKNRKTYEVQDCANYYFTSNHEDAVYLEAHDRRIFVHEVETMQPMVAAEYKAYATWLEKENGAARLFHYLRYEVSLEGFDPKGRAPMTSAKQDMAASGRGDAEDWAITLATNPDTVLPPSAKHDLYTVEELLKFYNDGDKQQIKSVGLGRALNAAGVFKLASGSNNIMIEGVRRRLYAVRHVDKYRNLSPTQARRMYEAQKPVSLLRTDVIAASRKFEPKPLASKPN